MPGLELDFDRSNKEALVLRYFIFNSVWGGYMHVIPGAQGAQKCGVPLELVLRWL